MATKLYLRNDNNSSKLSGYYDLIATAGNSSDTGVVATTASGTNIQWTKTSGGTALAWISGRIPAGGVTLTSADWDIWCRESGSSANAKLRVRLYKWHEGTETELTGSPFDESAELNSMAITNETGTADFTDTAFAENDRLVVKLFITNVGTMGAGYTCTVQFNVANGSTGDSAMNLAETITFKSDKAVGNTDTFAFSQSAVLKGKVNLYGNTGTFQFTQNAVIYSKQKLYRSGTSDITFSQNGVIRGKLNARGTTNLTFSQNAVLSIILNTSASSGITFSQSAILKGKGRLSGNTGTFQFTQNAVIYGKQTLYRSGTTDITFSQSAVGYRKRKEYISGSSQIAFSNIIYVKSHIIGSSDITIDVTGTLRTRAFVTGWTLTDNTVAGRTITLPLVQNRAEGALSYNCDVDWGDGTAHSTITSYDDADRIHTYSTIGSKTITITGVCEGWSFNNGGDKLKIDHVICWGGASFVGFKYLAGGFYGCTNIYYIPTHPISASGTGVLSDGFKQTFQDCTYLTSDYLRSNLFSSHPNVSSNGFYNTFYGCSITTIPADLFKYNTLVSSNAFRGTFYGCTLLTTIPDHLFDYNTLISSSGFFGTFQGCSKITSLPTDLFRYNTALSTSGFQGTFYGCSKITSLPDDLLRYNTLVSSAGFYNTFYSCNSLTSIPADLFRYNIQVSSSGFYSTFYSCTVLTSIPTDLFRYNTLVSSSGFYSTFYNCTVLASIPADLFRYNTVVSSNSFTVTFYNCNKLQLRSDIFYADGEQGTRFYNVSIEFLNCFYRASFTGTKGTAPDLWNCNFGSGTPTKTGCFSGAGNSCSSLSNYGLIPTDWGSTGAVCKQYISGATTINFIVLLNQQISGSSDITFSNEGDLYDSSVAPSALAGSADITFVSTAQVTYQEVTIWMLGQLLVWFTESANIRGKGKLSGSSALIFTNSVSLFGLGELKAESVITFSNQADLSGGITQGRLYANEPFGFSQRTRLFDDFNSYEVGQLAGQGRWEAYGSSSAHLVTAGKTITSDGVTQDYDYVDFSSDLNESEGWELSIKITKLDALSGENRIYLGWTNSLYIYGDYGAAFSWANASPILIEGTIFWRDASYQVGDVVKIKREGKHIEFYLNGEIDIEWYLSSGPATGDEGIFDCIYELDWEGYDWLWLYLVDQYIEIDDIRFDYNIVDGVTGTLRGIKYTQGISPVVFSCLGLVTGYGFLSGSSALMFSTQADLRYKATTKYTTGLSLLQFTQSGTLYGTGSGIGVSAIKFSEIADLHGKGQLSGLTDIGFIETGDVFGHGFLSGNIVSSATLSGIMRAVAYLSGASDITFSAEAEAILKAVTNVTFDVDGNLKMARLHYETIRGNSFITLSIDGGSKVIFSISGNSLVTETVQGVSPVTGELINDSKITSILVGNSLIDVP
jgi:hypothetical protein